MFLPKTIMYVVLLIRFIWADGAPINIKSTTSLETKTNFCNSRQGQIYFEI